MYGIFIILVPLHGLGSDQIEKSNMPDLAAEAHYIDEHKQSDATALCKRLLLLMIEKV